MWKCIKQRQSKKNSHTRHAHILHVQHAQKCMLIPKRVEKMCRCVCHETPMTFSVIFIVVY